MIELEYSLLNQSNAQTMQLAHAKGIGVIVRGGLGTGLLTSSVANHLNDKTMLYRKQILALVTLVNHDYAKLTALALSFLYENPNISSVIIGADKPEFINYDIHLLNTFTDTQLLNKAKALMQQFSPPLEFTENMGEFYKTEKF